MVDSGDVLRVAARQIYASTDEMVNVFHFVVGTAPTPNTDAVVMQDIVQFLATAFLTIDQLIDDSVVPVDCTIYHVTDDRPMGQVPWGTSYSGGTATGEGLPTHDACLLLFPTLVKRTVGRIYFPVFTEAAQSSGVWTSAVSTAVDSFASLFLSNFTGDEGAGIYRYAVYKRSIGEYTFPTGARLSPRVAIQSRRKRGRGS